MAHHRNILKIPRSGSSTAAQRSARPSRLTLAVAIVLAIASCAPDAFQGYREATELERADVVASIERYYAVRNSLATGVSIETFWNEHPALRDGRAPERGINAEQLFAQRVRASQVRSVVTDTTAYGPPRVAIDGDHAIALFHVLERWIFDTGADTIGETYTRFDLTRRGAGGWRIDRTDEELLGEPRTTFPPLSR